jgi:transketolase
MTHDSIGLGEDGPTHQPVEHLAALRAIPNLNVFRPADAIEVAECWELALLNAETPSILSLSRQGLPMLRTDATPENKSARGAYILAEGLGANGKPKKKRDVTLFATGSEVEIAMAARGILAKDDIAAAVVSMPCFELFENQDGRYRDTVIGDAPRVGIEAAVRQGWDRYLLPSEPFIGMTGFGASAPAGKLYEHFGITAAKVVEAAKAQVE